MAPSIGNFWRRGWRMTNGLACRPITKLSVAARVPWSVACVSWAPRARIHIHNLRRRKQSLSCPSSMLLTGERSATCPESVSIRRDPCPAAFFTGIRCRSALTCTMMSYFSSPARCYSACRTRRWHSTRQTQPGTFDRGNTYTTAGLSINLFSPFTRRAHV